jgi:3-hydroxyacyl-CoA dehydrogenase / enoyl-CoA hydratase / 3-hydroxybutyryl-CoA epimerase
VSYGDLRQLARTVSRMSQVPDDPAPLPVRSVAVIGAGTMGAGIASAALPFARVTLVDSDAAALATAHSLARRLIQRQVRDGLVSPLYARRWLRRLRTLREWSGDTATDLVIEAVSEDAELKRRVLRSIEPQLAPRAVWASNTSALPLQEIRSAARRPERVVGMHFFHPVPGSRLIEVAAHAAVDAEALSTVRGFAVMMGKAVLQVREVPGFFTTRVLTAFIGEALLLLAEGVPVQVIDGVAERFGFVLGPLALLDGVGLDVAADIAGNLRAPQGAEASALLGSLLRTGLRGAKGGAGFYLHRGVATPTVNPAIGCVGGATSLPVSAAMVRRRLVLRFVNEAARAEQKRIVASRAEADAASVLGLGFPASRGGPFQWAARQGHPVVAARLEDLATRLGPRFLPAACWQRPLEVAR